MRSALLIILLTISTSVFGQTTQKMGYVDTQKILALYAPAVQAQGKLDSYITQLTQSRDSMATAFQNELAAYQQQAQTMTPEKREATEKILVTKQQAVQKFEQDKFAQPNGAIYVKQQDLMAPITDKVYEAIEQVAKNMGINFIFDKTGDVVLLYADTEYDLTFKVMDVLNSMK